MTVGPELILGVFVHGFKGGSDTFADFPQRLQAILSPGGIEFEPIVYPPFDTRGELKVAVDNHITWLAKLLTEKTTEYRERGGNGNVRIILFGHSMGGLVISDVLLHSLTSPPSSTLPILGIIAYDSPLLGLNPNVFKSTFDKAMDITSKGQAAIAALGAGYGFFKSATGGGGGGEDKGKTSSSSSTKDSKPSSSSKAASSSSSKNNNKEVSIPPPAVSTSSTPGSGWTSLPFLASAALAGGAAAVVGAGWYHRDKLVEQWQWATSHLSFVGELWKVREMEERLDKVVGAEREKGIGFHCFYSLLPPTPTSPSRTFLILPTSSPQKNYFSPSLNSRVSANEIEGHVEMFDKSSGCYELGRETCRLVTEWVEKSRKGEMGFWKGDAVGDEEEKGKEKEEEDVRMV